jgi:UDP-N-acetylmuramoylalanine--D-glutamate ligase
MKAIIVGYGISGKAAQRFLYDRGYETVIWRDGEAMPNDEFDLCVLSPGVQRFTGHAAHIVPEFELPFFENAVKPKKIVAVTGTNGKTTVVNQIHNACENSVLCGNVGVPVSAAADRLNGTVAVAEVSSFMLEQSTIFRPDIAVITNITQDHLERHGTMREYIRCKKQIIARQTKRDFLVINRDDKNCREIGEAAERSKKPIVVWFSADRGLVWHRHWWGTQCLFRGADLGVQTPHGLANALASAAVGRILGIKKDTIAAACRPKVQRHRIEKVADKNGIVFYNDSKATNIASTLAAARCFTEPVNLILCGRTKGQNYDELFAGLPDNVANIIVFGEVAAEVSGRAENIFTVNNLEEATVKAAELAAENSIVLFSPGGSSFDQFENYEARGNEFCDYVKRIISAPKRIL